MRSLDDPSLAAHVFIATAPGGATASLTAAAILARKVTLGVWWCGAERRELHLRLLILSVEAGPEDTRAEGHVRGRRRDKIVAVRGGEGGNGSLVGRELDLLLIKLLVGEVRGLEVVSR